MPRVRYTFFALMLSMLSLSNAWAISSTSIFLKQQPIDGDTLGVDQFWQQLKLNQLKTRLVKLLPLSAWKRQPTWHPA